MNRVLIVANVAAMIQSFQMPNIRLLLKMGYHVDVACNFIEGNICSDEKIKEFQQELKQLGVRIYQVSFSRSATDFKGHIKAFQELSRIFSHNQYEFVHCHAPISGIITRVVAKAYHIPTVYTAHGFHFYKGAPLKNWFLYYPVEKICSYFTDLLVTINREDYKFARNKLNCKKVVYLPGVGIELPNPQKIAYHKEIREQLGISDESKVILSVGELSVRKNHQIIIKAMADIAEQYDLYYLIAGEGSQKSELQKLIKSLSLQNRVKLLGYRQDIYELQKVSDIFALPSYQEGLPVALMEAMAMGKPVICSAIRGNTDLIDCGKGGEFFLPDNVLTVKRAIKLMVESDEKIYQKYSKYNLEKIRKFRLERVMKKTKKLYRMMEKI